MRFYYSIGIPTEKEIEYLEEILKNKCTARIEKTGLLEMVMDDMYEINWIETKEEAEKIIETLRENKERTGTSWGREKKKSAGNYGKSKISHSSHTLLFLFGG